MIRGDKKAELQEEIADIFICFLKMFYHLNIDLEKEYIEKVKNQERFQQYEK